MNIPTSLTLALMLGGAAAAAQGAPLHKRTQPPQVTQETARHATGIVMTVDAVSGKLRLKDTAGKVSRYHAKQAKVDAAEGKVISLADISIGDEVTIAYDVTLKGRTATAIHRLHRALKK